MDAYSVYLNTFRYVMNADPSNKSSWCDIFKYLPCLRKVLSCYVCGGLLKNPHGPSKGGCLHYVCYKCIGGKVNVKPSCNFCRNISNYNEDKKLRVLVLCFKRLCAYISNSRLGSVILASSVNGHDNEVEHTQKVLQDADQFEDEYEFTPASTEPLKVLKQKPTEHRYTFSEYKPSTSGLMRKPDKSFTSPKTVTSPSKQKRGPKKSISVIALKSSPKSNASIHVKRLKRKALTTSRYTAKSKSRILGKNTIALSQGLLVSQRPHRELSGKFSVGQLWRETFVEDHFKAPPEVEVYPDSGIEIGNLSDQDHCSLSPKATDMAKVDKSSSMDKPVPEKVVYPMRDTRLHPVPEIEEKVSTVSENRRGSKKPKIPLKNPKMRFQKAQRKFSPRVPYFRKKEEEVSSSSGPRLTAKLPGGKIPQITSRGVTTRVKSAVNVKRRGDICRCARFKRPNQLTCFGQKCPCYRDRKACVDCLCNGCKNPRRHSDSAPPLMHVSRAKESHNSTNPCLSPDVDMSMPRLSPIPRI